MKNIKPERKKTSTSPFGSSGRISHDSSEFYSSKLYQNLPQHFQPAGEARDFPASLLDKVLLGTAEDMSLIPDNSVHLMITSPPYNVSKTYDKNLSLEQYLNFLRTVFKETFRVLVPGGRACINVANIGRKPYIPLADYLSMIMIETGFLMRGEIIWDKGASAGVSTAWGSWKSASNPVLRDTHEYILVFSKGSFKRQLSKQEKEKKQNTISKEDFIQWTKSVWSFPSGSAKKTGHPAPFPVELPHRLIQLYSFTGDIVLDPFMGSGTTAVAALQSGRHFTGFEIDENYIELSRKRINLLKNKEKK